jgi:hypothetical protein
VGAALVDWGEHSLLPLRQPFHFRHRRMVTEPRWKSAAVTVRMVTYHVCVPCETAWCDETSCWNCGRPTKAARTMRWNTIPLMRDLIEVEVRRARWRSEG